MRSPTRRGGPGQGIAVRHHGADLVAWTARDMVAEPGVSHERAPEEGSDLGSAGNEMEAPGVPRRLPQMPIETAIVRAGGLANAGADSGQAASGAAGEAEAGVRAQE